MAHVSHGSVIYSLHGIRESRSDRIVRDFKQRRVFLTQPRIAPYLYPSGLLKSDTCACTSHEWVSHVTKINNEFRCLCRGLVTITTGLGWSSICITTTFRRMSHVLPCPIKVRLPIHRMVRLNNASRENGEFPRVFPIVFQTVAVRGFYRARGDLMNDFFLTLPWLLKADAWKHSPYVSF